MTVFTPNLQCSFKISLLMQPNKSFTHNHLVTQITRHKSPKTSRTKEKSTWQHEATKQPLFINKTFWQPKSNNVDHMVYCSPVAIVNNWVNNKQYQEQHHLGRFAFAPIFIIIKRTDNIDRLICLWEKWSKEQHWPGCCRRNCVFIIQKRNNKHLLPRKMC